MRLLALVLALAPRGAIAQCVDSTNTGFTINGAPATCSQLSPFCAHPLYGCGVSEQCPVSCGACQSCDVAVTSLTIAGSPATCAQLAALGTSKDYACKHATFGATIREQCPETCGCGYCYMPPPPSPLIPPSPPQIPEHLRPPESPPPPAIPAPTAPPPFECADALSTRFAVEGQPANCSALAAVGACTDASNGCEVRRTCPVSCGACQSCDAESTADVGVYVGGQLASCSQLASLQQCTHGTNGASVRAACPASCECGVCPPCPPPFPPSPPSPPMAPRCATLIDLALILDASGSMQGYEAALRQFALGVLSQFELSSTEARVGLVTFSTTAVRPALAKAPPARGTHMPNPRVAHDTLSLHPRPRLCVTADTVRACAFALCPSLAVGHFRPVR